MRVVSLVATLCLTLSLAVQHNLCAGTQAVVNAGSLPPAQAAAGWVRLYDGISLVGWNNSATHPWTSTENALTPPKIGAQPLSSLIPFGNYELAIEYRLGPHSEAAILVRCPLTDRPSENNSYAVKIRNVSDTETSPTRLTIRSQPTGISVFSLDADQSVSDKSISKLGKVALALVKGTVAFSTIRLHPLNSSKLDLKPGSGDAWKALPADWKGFHIDSVEGIKLSNGPGELQIPSPPGPYMFQANVTALSKSRGSVRVHATEHTPSSGVEVRIDNRWNGIDRTKPIDYGTGAIYGVKQAREVVSTDGEPFALTIGCSPDGSICVWVDGYMVAWITGKYGPPLSPAIALSVLGKDSQLSFKNVRISATAVERK